MGGNKGGGILMPGSSETPSPAGNRIDLSKHRHFAKNRIVYGQEIHYNEYQPDGSYIGEDADAERSAIENVARPNSKNKLTKQTELRNKIIEDTQRRKAVILRAKEENKNGKDGANPDIETKPELKHVREEDSWYDTAKNVIKSPEALIGSGTYGVVKGVGKYLGKHLPGVGAAFSAADATHRFKQGDYGGAAISGLSGAASFVPVVGTAASMGLDAYNVERDQAIENPNSDLAQAVNDPEGLSFIGKSMYPNPAAPSNKPSSATLAGGPRDDRAPSAPSTSTPSAPVSDTTPNKFGDAFRAARKAHGGSGGTFEWNGKKYTTDLATDKRPAPAKPASGPISRGTDSAPRPAMYGAKPVQQEPLAAPAPQQSQGINSTNTPASPTMGSSWNNSYKNKYSMGPGPSQFPSK
jgi:hypothetical protein